jgi:hypothetical protein
LNEGKVVGGEPVVARRHPTTLFDPVAMRILSDALDEIAKLDLTLGDVLAVYGQALVGLASAAVVDE